jgi:translocation and assembly module TamB
MSTQAANPVTSPAAKQRHVGKRAQAAVGVVLLALAMFAAWYFTSTRFQEHMRRLLVAKIEQATGGRVELRAMRWRLAYLELEADGLTLHGTEPADQAPLFYADRIRIALKPLGYLRPRLELRELSVIAPKIHILTNADGTTNIPGPKTPSRPPAERVEQLFEVAAREMELRNGTLLWNDREIPLDAAASDVIAALLWDKQSRCYDANLHVGRAEIAKHGLRPFAATADLHASVYRDRVAISSLRIASQQTRVDLSGTVVDFRQPKLDFDYKASLQLGQIASIVRYPELHGGTAELSGHGTYSLQTFQTTGKAALRNGSLDAGVFRLRELNAGVDYVADQTRIRLPHVFAHGMGGTVTGELEIVNYLSSAERTGKDEQRAEGKFRVEDVVLSHVINAVSSEDLPLDKLNAESMISGTAGLTWRGTPERAIAHFDLDSAAPPPGSIPGRIPYSVRLLGDFDFKHNAMIIESGEVRTPASHVLVHGTISQDSDLQMSARSINAGEFAGLIAALRSRDAGPMPVEFGGLTTFEGSLHNKIARPVIDGQAYAENLTLILPRSTFGGNDQSYVRIPWDSVSSTISYDSSRMAFRDSTLQRGNMLLKLSMFAQLQNNTLPDDSEMQVHAQLQRARVSDLLSIVGEHYSMDGEVGFVADLAGSPKDLRGTGHATLRDATVFGESVQSVSADLDFGGGQAHFPRFELHAAHGVAAGTLGYNVLGQSLSFRLNGSGFRLEQVRSLAGNPKLQLSGEARFELSGIVNAAEPVLNGDVHLSSLTLNGKTLGGFDLNAATKGAEMRVTGRSSSSVAQVTADATLLMRGELPVRSTVKISSNDLNPAIAALMPLRLTGPTAVESEVRISGPLRNPRNLFADISIPKLSANVQGLALVNDGPLAFQISEQVLRVESCRIGGEQSRFFDVRGTAELAGTQRISMRATGDVNLKLLRLIDPDVLSGGAAKFSVNIGGVLANPTLQGRLRVTNGSVSYTDMPNGLSDINGTMVFNRDRLEVEDLVAKTGGGELRLGGFLTYMRPQGIYANLSATGHDIRIRYPEGVSSTANAELSLVGSMQNATLSGDVTVTRLGFNRAFDFALYLARSKQPPTNIVDVDSPLNRLHLDVHIVSTPELNVQTSLARFSGNLDLHLRGTVLRPVVLGRVNILDGDFAFNATKYHVERGDVTFSNPVKIEPNLDLEASARVRDYDITLGFHGTLDKLNTTYRSDPPLPSQDIIALLALGRTREESANPAMLGSQQGGATSNATIGASASDALLSQAVNAAVSSRVQKIFGVSRLKIDPQVGGPENNPNARLTVEQEVSNQVTLTYITNLSQSAQQVIQVEYHLNRDVSIVGLRDQTGIVSFDVRIRKRKR